MHNLQEVFNKFTLFIEKYNKFLENTKDKKVLLLELGVGVNTPETIRFSFEQMVNQNSNWNLVRVNKDNCMTFLDIKDKYIDSDIYMKHQ